MSRRHHDRFDELKLGMRFKSGETTVNREDIKRFASEFDPQPFHLDEAAESVFAEADRLGRWMEARLTTTVMAGLVPATHVFIASRSSRRGCPAQGRA